MGAEAISEAGSNRGLATSVICSCCDPPLEAAHGMQHSFCSQAESSGYFNGLDDEIGGGRDQRDAF